MAVSMWNPGSNENSIGHRCMIRPNEVIDGHSTQVLVCTDFTKLDIKLEHG